MQPVEGPTKTCPECKSMVFETDTVCGFCGHVFTAQLSAAVSVASQGAWPKTYQYQKWGSSGLFFNIIGMAAFVLVVLGAFTAFISRSNPEGLMPLLVVDAGIACLFVFVGVRLYQIATNASITITAGSVDWTSRTGERFTIPNSQLNFENELKTGTNYKYAFGTKDGPKCSIIPGLEGLDEAVAEIKRRIVR